MRGFHPGRLLAAFTFVVAFSAIAGAGDIVSSMRNVNAVMESQGFRINPAFDHSGQVVEGDLAPVQAFEIMRPDGRAFSIGRLFTSCVCIQLESPKRNFAEGERAIMRLRNVKPTPTNGQIYAIYVQITSPIKATLRFDTFVQSNHPDMPELAERTNLDDNANDAAPAHVAEAVPAVAEESEPAAPAADEPVSDEQAAIAAEADQRVADATAAANAMAASMDDYFAELSTTPQPQALPPPPMEDLGGIPPVADVDSATETIPSSLPPLADDDDVPTPPAEGTPPASVAATPEPAPESATLTPPPVETAASPLAPPPAETTAAREPAPVAEPVQPATAPLSPGVGTRLEEVYQASTVTPAPEAPEARRAPGTPIRNVSLITIGVKDLFRSIRFYEALGWEMAPRGKYDQTAFFQLNGQVLVLYPVPELLKEQNMEGATPSPGGITLAIHVGNRDDAFSTYQAFIDAGGTPLKPPTEMISGSVTGYVADPDGNPWEISWVPQFRVDENGWLWLP